MVATEHLKTFHISRLRKQFRKYQRCVERPKKDMLVKRVRMIWCSPTTFGIDIQNFLSTEEQYQLLHIQFTCKKLKAAAKERKKRVEREARKQEIEGELGR